MTQKKTTNDISTAGKMGIGLGLTAAAVTAAGAYFLYGSNKAASNRKKVKGWVLKAKGEVLEALENAKEMSEDEYNALVEAASGAYGTMKNASKGEVKDFKNEMHQHWVKLQKSNVMKKAGKAKSTVKSVAKKVVKASPKATTAKTSAKGVVKKS